jgi:serine/threonine protein kinase
MRRDVPAPVAIKQIKNKEAPAELLLQLKNELEHTHDSTIPGVRKAIRLENINGKPSLVMEYVDGLTLKEAFFIKDRPLADFLKVAAKIADAVSEIHHHQVIHKDLNSKTYPGQPGPVDHNHY